MISLEATHDQVIIAVVGVVGLVLVAVIQNWHGIAQSRSGHIETIEEVKSTRQELMDHEVRAAERLGAIEERVAIMQLQLNEIFEYEDEQANGALEHPLPKTENDP